MNGEITVLIGGRQTPVVLKSRGPELSEADVERFERRLGCRLPDSYREFLLKYNGGEPVVGVVNGRDDDPDIPYHHGDSVSILLQLPTASAPVDEYHELRLPEDIPWDLPRYIFPIAGDEGGNYFVFDLRASKGLIRFLNHEALDEPLEQHRVMADDFLDLLLRIRSVEEEEAIKKARYEAERKVLETGQFPSKLESQCRAVQNRAPEIRQWIRMMTLKIFEAKGHFSVHDDELSRTLLDLAFWLYQNARAEDRATKRTELATLVRCWWKEDDDGFGLSGYAPDFINEWWNDRISKGTLEGSVESARLTDQASSMLLQKFQAMRQ